MKKCYDTSKYGCSKELDGECLSGIDCDKQKKPLSSDAVLGEGWRDIRKEKPVTNDLIMIYTDYNGGSYCIGRYSDKTWRGNFAGKIIAWRPLPDPPTFD